MTSDEKDKKMAMYYDEFDEEDHDAEFNPEDDYDDDDDESSTYSSSSDGNSNDTTMHGSLHISHHDEGKVVYNGTWSYNKTPEKKQKFKLKSKQSQSNFDVNNPLVDKQKKRRTLLMDGFFWMVDEDGESRKVKERDVELTFFCGEDDEEGNAQDEKKDALENGHEKTDGSNNVESKEKSSSGKTAETVQSYVVKGRGCNEFGGFVLEGKYSIPSPSSPNHQHDHNNNHNTLICSKHYLTDQDKKPHKEDEDDTKKGSTFIRRRRKRQEETDSEEDDDDFPEEETDFNELIALNEEANMSVEELRKRYMSDAPKERETPTKKSRTGGEESDEDEYGF